MMYEPRTSPSGTPMPVALLTLSAPAAFVDGTLLAIPFDTVAFTRGDPGHLIHPPVDGFTWNTTTGLYLVEVQATLSANVDRAECIIGAQNGSRSYNVISDIGNTGHLGAVQFSATMLFPASDVAVSPPTIFTAIGATFQGFGASGNIEAGASMLIWPLYMFT